MLRSEGDEVSPGTLELLGGPRELVALVTLDGLRAGGQEAQEEEQKADPGRGGGGRSHC